MRTVVKLAQDLLTAFILVLFGLLLASWLNYDIARAALACVVCFCGAALHVADAVWLAVDGR